MIPESSTPNTSIPVEIQAEAAAWIARLHGVDRTHEDDRSFRRWMAANELHARAFEKMTELWNAAAALESTVLQNRARGDVAGHGGARRGASRMLAFSGALLAAFVIVFLGVFHFDDDAIATRVGERRTLTLEDGTRLTLNTATRLQVQYTDTRRQVALETGEAFFEVARQPQRPFIVTTDNGAITAVGTTFAVRSLDHKTEVTLVEGKVTVVAPLQAPQPPFVLIPGERLTLAAARKPAVDHPAVDKVTAWRQGLITLDQTQLKDAIGEMNRYSPIKLVMEQPNEMNVRVSGVFQAGDSLEFARALARTHGIRSQQIGNHILLYAPR